MLAYQSAATFSPKLAWFDRSGRRLGDLTMPGPIKSVRVSPDGQRFAVDVIDPRTGTSDIWIQDLARGIPQRFTSEPTDEINPIWSGDGSWIIFRSDREGPPDIHARPLSGAGDEKVVFASNGVQQPHDVSRDGVLAFMEEDRAMRADLWLLPMTGAAKPRVFLRTPFEERDAVFSPGGDLIAFESDESGAPEIYVAPVDESGARRRVSSAGGQTPRWGPDDTELFYLAEDSVIMRVPLTPGAGMRAGPVQLFRTGARLANYVFDVSPDGQRFLVNLAMDDDRAPVTVLPDWMAALDR